MNDALAQSAASSPDRAGADRNSALPSTLLTDPPRSLGAQSATLRVLHLDGVGMTSFNLATATSSMERGFPSLEYLSLRNNGLTQFRLGASRPRQGSAAAGNVVQRAPMVRRQPQGTLVSRKSPPGDPDTVLFPLLHWLDLSGNPSCVDVQPLAHASVAVVSFADLRRFPSTAASRLLAGCVAGEVWVDSPPTNPTSIAAPLSIADTCLWAHAVNGCLTRPQDRALAVTATNAGIFAVRRHMSHYPSAPPQQHVVGLALKAAEVGRAGRMASNKLQPVHLGLVSEQLCVLRLAAVSDITTASQPQAARVEEEEDDAPHPPPLPAVSAATREAIGYLEHRCSAEGRTLAETSAAVEAILEMDPEAPALRRLRGPGATWPDFVRTWLSRSDAAPKPASTRRAPRTKSPDAHSGMQMPLGLQPTPAEHETTRASATPSRQRSSAAAAAEFRDLFFRRSTTPAVTTRPPSSVDPSMNSTLTSRPASRLTVISCDLADLTHHQSMAQRSTPVPEPAPTTDAGPPEPYQPHGFLSTKLKIAADTRLRRPIAIQSQSRRSDAQTPSLLTGPTPLPGEVAGQLRRGSRIPRVGDQVQFPEEDALGQAYLIISRLDPDHGRVLASDGGGGQRSLLVSSLRLRPGWQTAEAYRATWIVQPMSTREVVHPEQDPASLISPERQHQRRVARTPAKKNTSLVERLRALRRSKREKEEAEERFFEDAAGSDEPPPGGSTFVTAGDDAAPRPSPSGDDEQTANANDATERLEHLPRTWTLEERERLGSVTETAAGDLTGLLDAFDRVWLEECNGRAPRGVVSRCASTFLLTNHAQNGSQLPNVTMKEVVNRFQRPSSRHQ